MNGSACITQQIDDNDGMAAIAPMLRAEDVAGTISDGQPDLVLTDAGDAVAIAAWHALAAASPPANAFAEPWLALAGLRHCDTARTARLALIAERESTHAIIPLLVQPRLGRIPLCTVATWSHPNSFLSPALAVPGQESGAWQAILAGIAPHFPGAHAFIADGLVENSPLHRGLLAAAATLGLPVSVESRTVRAMLATDLDADAYWETAVRAKKRKELRRQWARLGEEGALTVDHGKGVSEAAIWIAEFLTLEASGWKGANGSALANQPDTRAFFTEAMTAGWAQGKVLLTALRIDGRAIAMLITLLSGNTGFSFKTAFDEQFARFSPGVLLQRESLSLLTSRKLAFIDSCAAQDHPMIDSLWRERRAVISLSMPLPGAANRLLWQAAQSAMRAWRGIKDMRQSPARVREGLGVCLTEGDAAELTAPPVTGDTRFPSPPPASGRGDKPAKDDA